MTATSGISPATTVTPFVPAVVDTAGMAFMRRLFPAPALPLRPLRCAGHRLPASMPERGWVGMEGCWHGSAAAAFSEDAQLCLDRAVQSTKQGVGDVVREQNEGELGA